MRDERTESTIVPADEIERSILTIRGRKVMLDDDLARLYGVSTKRLNQQVNRNRLRFPEDFMFELTRGEVKIVKSTYPTSGSAWGGRRTLPYAFTEHGAVMLATILNSPRAVRASILVVRAFVRLRTILAAHEELARRLDDLERKTDRGFAEVFVVLRELIAPPGGSRRAIGFGASEGDDRRGP